MLDEKWLRGVEKQMRLLQVAPIFVISHDQDKINNGLKYRCEVCGNGVSIGLGVEYPIHQEIVICPTCKDHKLMAHLNVNLN